MQLQGTSGDLGRPLATHSQPKGTWGPPRARGQLLPSPRPGRAVDKRERRGRHTARPHPQRPTRYAGASCALPAPDLGGVLPGGWAGPLQPLHIIDLVHLDLKGLLPGPSQGRGQVHPLPGLVAQGHSVRQWGGDQPSPLQAWTVGGGGCHLSRAQRPAQALAQGPGERTRGPTPEALCPVLAQAQPALAPSGPDRRPSPDSQSSPAPAAPGTDTFPAPAQASHRPAPAWRPNCACPACQRMAESQPRTARGPGCPPGSAEVEGAGDGGGNG